MTLAAVRCFAPPEGCTAAAQPIEISRAQPPLWNASTHNPAADTDRRKRLVVQGTQIPTVKSGRTVLSASDHMNTYFDIAVFLIPRLRLGIYERD